MSAGGAVLRFQSKPVMHSDAGAPIKTFLEVNRLDFLLPPKAPDPVKALDIPEAILTAAKAGNQTAKVEIFKRVHGDKPRTQEAESLAKVEALIAGEALTQPTLDNELPPVDDRTRRAARAADISHAANPWAAGPSFNVTAQGKLTAVLIKAHGEAEGLRRAEAIANAAGTSINSPRTKARASA
jgi:hypothetical protein